MTTTPDPFTYLPRGSVLLIESDEHHDTVKITGPEVLAPIVTHRVYEGSPNLAAVSVTPMDTTDVRITIGTSPDRTMMTFQGPTGWVTVHVPMSMADLAHAFVDALVKNEPFA